MSRFLLLAAVGVGMAACGDDAESGTNSDSGAPGVEAPSTTSASTAIVDAQPIRIASIAPLSGASLTQPDVEQALQMAVERVNLDGGIGGRPLELDVCDDAGTPDGALECGRDVQSNEATVASVGGFSIPGEDYGEALGDAGVAIIGAYPAASWQLLAPTSFPFVGGTTPNFVGMGQIAKDYERVAFVRVDIAATGPLTGLIESSGVDIAADVAIPPGAPDVSSFVDQALESGTDAVILGLGEPLQTQVAQAIHQQGGGEVDVIMSGAAYGEELLAALGDASENVRGVLSFPPVSAAGDYELIQDFVDDREGLGFDVDSMDIALNAYASVRWFAEEASALIERGDEVTRETVLSHMESLSTVSVFDLFPAIDFASPVQVEGLPFTRLFNPYGYFAQGSPDGWVLDSGDAVNFFSGESGS